LIIYVNSTGVKGNYGFFGYGYFVTVIEWACLSQTLQRMTALLIERGASFWGEES